VTVARYRTTFNPATGEHIQYVVTGLESNGAVVRYRWTSDPGGSITDHTHPGSMEIFTIVEGTCDFTVGGKSITLGPGETGIVPPGVVHSENNRSGLLVRGIVELQPAAKTAELHDTLAGIGSDLPHTPQGAPKSLLQLGATFWYFRNDIRATSPPIWLQNLFLPVLASLAKVRGVVPERPEWSSRLPDDAPDPTPLFDESAYSLPLTRAGYDFPITDPRPLPIH
jgi:quercetin dioxygenase-like cupin family protein